MPFTPRPRSLFPFVVLATASACASGGLVTAPSPAAPALAGRSFTCSPLRIEGGSVRIATEAASSLHVTGGSGTATFSLVNGGGSGATIEPGGGLRAGRRAAAFEAVANDGLCKTEARAPVNVIGPFDVQPESIVLARDANLAFASRGALGDVHYIMLDKPAGAGRPATLDPKGKLWAGDLEGTYHLAARDAGSGKEARLTVTVGQPVALHPRVGILLVPAGGRVRLDFAGGSAHVEPTATTGATGAKAVLEDGEAWFDARGAHPGIAEVAVRDRFTHETAKVRVIVGATLGEPPIVRGTQTMLGDLASGDVNGDGHADLIVGHAERSKTAFEAGGIVVYSGKSDGGVDPKPATTIEGTLAFDHYGAVLAVRDVNGDGIDDVVTGVPDSDLGETDRGAVAFHLGAKEGLELEADRVLSGEGGGHRFGSALALADLDGDDAIDLVTSAPGARNPFAAGCEGRVYVYKNRKARRGVFATIPSQVIDVKAPLGESPEARGTCAVGLGAGRALALVDLDADGIVDLAVGAPRAKGSGMVLVYRGLTGGAFEPDAAWAIQLDPALKGAAASFGEGLDVVAQSLVVRAPTFAASGAAAAGGFWIFPRGSLGPPGRDKATRVVDTRAARAFSVGKAARGVGRSALVADVDPEPGDEYIVGAASPGAPGGVLVFSNAQMAKAAGALVPLGDLAGDGATGFRLAFLSGGPLAVWAPWRSTRVGAFAGAIDLVAPPVKAKWMQRSAIELPSFGAGDRAGSSVVLAALDKGGPTRAVVAAPGAHSPLDGAHPPGERLRAGVVGVFGDDPQAPLARVVGARNEAQLGAAGVVALDFDGDGRLELAIADPNETAGGPLAVGLSDPVGCSPLDAKGQSVAQGGRGVVRIYAWEAGQLVERWRLTGPREAMRDEPGAPKYSRNRFGFAIAAADVNGDGKDDLIVGRPGSRDASGAEVVLGRKAEPGKVLVACSVGETGAHGALFVSSSSAGDPISMGAAVARVGDLDKDGCDEVALAITPGGFGGPPRGGVALAFGFDPSGARCHGHRTPLVLRLVPDDHPLRDNVAGDPKSRLDDANDLRMPVGMGRVLAQGGGDFTGDGVPDLVYRDLDLPFGEHRGPAVEILSGAWLAGLCPNHVCPKGAHGPLFSDGDYHVVGVRPLAPPVRVILPSRGIARGFGAAMALADLTGDGIAELAVGSTDESDEGQFAGEVRIYRGGAATTTQEALLGDPFAIAVGDTSERTSFGTSLALSKNGWLLVGAPTATRWHLGGNVGAAHLWRIEVMK